MARRVAAVDLPAVTLGGDAWRAVVDNYAIAREVEVLVQPMKCLLDPLVAHGLDQCDDLLAQVLKRWNEDALAVEKKPIGGTPWR